MMRLFKPALLSLILWSVCAPAQAADFPDDRFVIAAEQAFVPEPAVASYMAASFQAGEIWWRAQGIGVCTSPRLHLVPIIFKPEDGMAAVVNGCKMWIAEPYLARLTQAIQSYDTVTLQNFCGLIFHELGHTAGLHHSEDPSSIMYSGLAAGLEPPPCRTLAYALPGTPVSKGVNRPLIRTFATMRAQIRRARRALDKRGHR